MSCRCCIYKKNYKKNRGQWSFLNKRLSVLYNFKDNAKCSICNSNFNIHIHHLIPKGKGGCDNIVNLILLCQHCHILQH